MGSLSRGTAPPIDANPRHILKIKIQTFFFVCSPLSLSAKLRGDGELGRASVNVIRRAKRPVTNQRAAGAYTERREEKIPEERVPSLYG